MKELKEFNDYFARMIGRNRFGEPLYKWAYLPDMRHWRYQRGEDDWSLHKGVWIPRPNFEEVPSYPHLPDRWAIVKHEFMDDTTWHRRFGPHAVWPPQGCYLVTDVVLQVGFLPTWGLTERIVQGIKQTWARSAVEYEQMVESEMEREEDFTFRTLYDMIEDACTAYGNKPGSRSGGVSFPHTKRKERSEVILCQ